MLYAATDLEGVTGPRAFRGRRFARPRMDRQVAVQMLKNPARRAKRSQARPSEGRTEHGAGSSRVVPVGDRLADQPDTIHDRAAAVEADRVASDGSHALEHVARRRGCRHRSTCITAWPSSAWRCERPCSPRPTRPIRNDSPPGRPTRRRVPWEFGLIRRRSRHLCRHSSALPPSPLARAGAFA